MMWNLLFPSHGCVFLQGYSSTLANKDSLNLRRLRELLLLSLVELHELTNGQVEQDVLRATGNADSRNIAKDRCERG